MKSILILMLCSATLISCKKHVSVVTTDPPKQTVDKGVGAYKGDGMRVVRSANSGAGETRDTSYFSSIVGVRDAGNDLMKFSIDFIYPVYSKSTYAYKPTNHYHLSIDEPYSVNTADIDVDTISKTIKVMYYTFSGGLGGASNVTNLTFTGQKQ